MKVIAGERSKEGTRKRREERSRNTSKAGEAGRGDSERLDVAGRRKGL